MSEDHAVRHAEMVLRRAGRPDDLTYRMRRAIQLRSFARCLQTAEKKLREEYLSRDVDGSLRGTVFITPEDPIAQTFSELLRTRLLIRTVEVEFEADERVFHHDYGLEVDPPLVFKLIASFDHTRPGLRYAFYISIWKIQARCLEMTASALFQIYNCWRRRGQKPLFESWGESYTIERESP